MTDGVESGAKAGRKIGVFGGTFDPPHIGHLVAAVDAKEALGLDVVLMVVADVPWQKVDSRRVTPSHHRLAMTVAAVGDREGIEASDIEIGRGGPTYTVDTLAELLVAEVDRRVKLHGDQLERWKLFAWADETQPPVLDAGPEGERLYPTYGQSILLRDVAAAADKRQALIDVARDALKAEREHVLEAIWPS